MDPCYSAQDIVQCFLCNDNIVQNYCDFCHVNLCKACIGEHISDGYDKHKIVTFQQRKSTLIFPSCKKHSKETCRLQCQSCNFFMCAKCYISKEHKDHNVIDLENSYNSKKANIEKDMEEIRNVIFPTYEEMRKTLESQIDSLDGNYEKITSMISRKGEEWHKEIDRSIKQLKNEINEIKVHHRDILKKHLKEIEQIESLVKENIRTLEDIQRESNVVSAIIEYKSRNNELGKLPPKVEVLLPTFCSEPLDRGKVYKMIGSIKPLTSTTDANGYELKKQMEPYRELLDTPEVIKTFNTGYNSLSSVSFCSTQEIWTSAEIPEIKCFNINGNSINSIKTKSGEYPNDIAVTSDGCMLYCDWMGNVNKVVNGRIEKRIKLLGWVPGNLCVTSTDDLLVVMCNDDKTHCKVVRYSGSVVKQTIQYDKNGKPLYSGVFKVKYIAENRNLDICVADRAARAVVVVSQAGKVRFRYTGHPSKENPFIPRGITTNSQSQILVADFGNICIHILNQDGQFLRFINGINEPCGLSVDTLDNLFIAEYKTGDVKVIKYLK